MWPSCTPEPPGLALRRRGSPVRRGAVVRSSSGLCSASTVCTGRDWPGRPAGGQAGPWDWAVEKDGEGDSEVLRPPLAGEVKPRGVTGP